MCKSRIQTSDPCVQAVEDSIRLTLRGTCSWDLIFCTLHFHAPTIRIPKWLILILVHCAMISWYYNFSLFCSILISCCLAIPVDSSSNACDLYFDSSASNIGWGICYPGWQFRSSLQNLQAFLGMIFQMRPRPLPSTTFLVHCVMSHIRVIYCHRQSLVNGQKIL